MPQKSIKSLQRAFDILFSFTNEHPTMTIDDISSYTHIPKSTCYRLVHDLKSRDLLTFDKDVGSYRLGFALLHLSSIATGSMDLVQVARPFLVCLATQSGETVQLIRRSGTSAVCIDKVESPQALSVRPDTGSIIGLHSGASGKAILAFLPQDEFINITKKISLARFGPNTITDLEQLKENLTEIRQSGFATSDQEIYVGVSALAAPIFDSSGKAVASVSVAGPRERLTKERIVSLIPNVISTASSISSKLGLLSTSVNNSNV